MSIWRVAAVRGARPTARRQLDVSAGRLRPIARPPAAAASGNGTFLPAEEQQPMLEQPQPSSSSSISAGLYSRRHPRLDAEIKEVLSEEIRAWEEAELAKLDAAVQQALEEERAATASTMREAVATAMQGFNGMKLTANINTLMAVTGVISYWRGVGGLLDWLFEDSLEGYVVCTVFGMMVIGIIRLLKLPVAENSGLGL